MTQALSQNKHRNRYTQVFLLALLCAGAVFIPFILFDRGYFIYYGDFNVQQIPFYQLAHRAVRSGELFWNWKTDLGVNFIGSYSFYLLLSPFFWLTLPFPTSFLPHLMAPLLILKTACAALTAFCYLRRFTRDERYAVIGGLLYAFSGWMTFNIFFNHFHEPAILFPLLLLALEKLVCDDCRWGLLALMVAANAAGNYWFFIGEAVFVILYVAVRTSMRAWPMTGGKFLRIAGEAVIGVGLAAVVLVPSVLALTGNPRTGLSELLTGWNFWRYWDDQQQGAILWSFFYPPELPARPNFFPDVGTKWSSLSAWLPLLGPVGVMAYFGMKKRDWLKTMLGVCFVMALIPGLNSLFILLNHSYYARWFYMPLLLMSLASVRAVDESGRDVSRFASMLKWYLLITVAFVLMAGVTPNKTDDGWKFGLGEYSTQVWVWFGVVVLCIALTSILMLYWREKPDFTVRFGALTALVAVGFTIFYMANGKLTFERSNYVINTAIGGREKLDLPQDVWARSDIYEGQDNLLMFWDLPNIQAFHSIVPPSIMEFYPAVGVKRDVGSRPESSFYALRPLLSVRWLFIEANKEEQEPMPGYVKYAEQAGFNVYENENFLPMGFSYDHYVLSEDKGNVVTNRLSNLMLRAVLLDEDAAERNADLLTRLSEEDFSELGKSSMQRDAAARREYTVTDFAPDASGFSARSSFEEERLVFFSVPYEAGWSAFVNGEPVQIEKANIGFMAIRIPAGDCEIRFRYMTPGLIRGALLSGSALLFWLAWFLVAKRREQRERMKELAWQRKQADTGVLRLSWDEFLGGHNQEERRELLRRALNEQAAREIETALPDRERTLRFELPEPEDVPGQTGGADEPHE